MLASTVGGFIAGRLRTKWVGVHEHEVFFRDTAHGFLAWGLATVLGAAFLASAASNIAGFESSAPASGGPVDYYVDALLRSNPAASQNTTDMEATRREIARILVTDFRSGDVPASDRTYLAQVVAVRTGLSQEDADKRVSDVFNQAKTALDNAGAGMSGIIGTQILPSVNPELNRGGSHGSWNSAVAVRCSNSNHHSSRTLPS